MKYAHCANYPLLSFSGWMAAVLLIPSGVSAPSVGFCPKLQVLIKWNQVWYSRAESRNIIHWSRNEKGEVWSKTPSPCRNGNEEILRSKHQTRHQGSRKRVEISMGSCGQWGYAQSSMLLCTWHKLCLIEFKSLPWVKILAWQWSKSSFISHL